MKKLLYSLAALTIITLSLSFTFKSSNGYKIGDKATDFKLENVNGKTVSLSDYPNAKAYVVIFTCNHCPYSKMYEERINELSKKYAKENVPVIAINPNSSARADESLAEMKIRAKEKNFDFPYLADNGQTVTDAFGATRTPHVFILDQNRKVQYIGAIDNNSRSAEKASAFYVEDAVDALIAGKKPEVSKTKAVGCSVKKAK